ncbi:VOC family protein [Neobacillus mesonae]|uniref:VOC family protein n=1 Tax=Neobacillus mesonae TaxID=1193713 RepID=UPI002040BCA3|nr:VOC family protein [Neobacillus mesonae]MCM3567513.1 VOC family protein [Neobacillus mesonae]
MRNGKLFPNPFHNGSIQQLCYAVNNLEEAAKQWAAVFGAGPFFERMHRPVDELIYKGEAASLDHSHALGQWGPIQIELWLQHCDSPAGMKEMNTIKEGFGKFHHISYTANHFDQEVERMENLGFSVIWECTAKSGMRVAMFDTRTITGAMTEVYEKNVLITDLYKRIAKAAEGWDGTRPYRKEEEIPE